jgi:uncharacterized protein YkwD
MKSLKFGIFFVVFFASSTFASISLEAEILRHTNQERERFEKVPLRMNAQLQEAARLHTLAMADQETLAHELNGEGPGERIEKTGFVASAWAENIAMGYSDAASVVAGWMNSPGHRENLLDLNAQGFTEIGISAVRSKNGRLYYCQVFARAG